MSAIEELLKDLPTNYMYHTTLSIDSTVIFIMEREGKAVCKMSWWNNDTSIVYLDWLSVNEDIRKNGIGTELQKIREEIGVRLGATTACLQVRRDTWMYEWYKRRGYTDWKVNNTEDNFIWMRKEL